MSTQRIFYEDAAYMLWIFWTYAIKILNICYEYSKNMLSTCKEHVDYMLRTCWAIDSFTPGRRTGSSFFQILYQQSQQNIILLSFVEIHKIWIFTKFGVCSSKIEPSRSISILKFKRAWQTQFFSHTLQILVNDRFFIGRQIIFYSIFLYLQQKSWNLI